MTVILLQRSNMICRKRLTWSLGLTKPNSNPQWRKPTSFFTFINQKLIQKMQNSFWNNKPIFQITSRMEKNAENIRQDSFMFQNSREFIIHAGIPKNTYIKISQIVKFTWIYNVIHNMAINSNDHEYLGLIDQEVPKIIRSVLPMSS